MWDTIQQVIGIISGLVGIVTPLVGLVSWLRRRGKASGEDTYPSEQERPLSKRPVVRARRVRPPVHEFPAHDEPVGSDETRVRASVNAAAIGMLVAGCFGVLFNTLGVFTAAVVSARGESGDAPVGVLAVIYVGGLTAAGSAVFAATQMRRFRNFPLAVAGSVAVMFSGSWCCLAGVPVGVWCLVVLLKPGARTAFV